MKIGELAGLLGRDSDELATNLELQEGQLDEDLTDEQIGKLVEETVKKSFSDGKQQGHDWGRKTALTEVEKKLNNSFKTKGSFDDIVTQLDEKISSAGSSKSDAYKVKFTALQEEFETYKTDIANKEKSKKVLGKLNDILDLFTGSDKVKSMVANEFTSNVKHDIDGDDVLLFDDKDAPLKVDGKFVEFDDYAKTFISGFLPLSEEKSKTPKTPSKSPSIKTPSGLSSPGEVLQAMRVAKTAEERAMLQKKLEEMT